MKSGAGRIGRSGLALLAGLAGLWACLPAGAAGGIPEPGWVIHGLVSNLPPQQMATATLVWTVSRDEDRSVVTSRWVSVNGQVHYVADIPFETRRIAGADPLPPNDNTLELPSAPAAFTRHVSLNEVPLPLPSEMSWFGPADRGRMDRLDLDASSTAGDSFEAWLTHYPALPLDQRGRTDDPDRDGFTNYDEYLAGTDPTDPASALVITRLDPLSRGYRLTWRSIPGRRYRVERTTDLGEELEPLVNVVTGASSPALETHFDDITVPPSADLFYRVSLIDD